MGRLDAPLVFIDILGLIGMRAPLPRITMATVEQLEARYFDVFDKSVAREPNPSFDVSRRATALAAFQRLRSSRLAGD
jgi:hypothetical protein